VKHPDRPNPPAAAYPIVAEAIDSCALGQDYFTTAAPTTGVRVQVVGVDNVQTTWFLATQLGTRLVAALQKHPAIRRVVGESYHDARVGS
jgi:spore coat polysaccharide biosynthesis protein SpsF (cytidylyltransferase family)